MIKSGQTAYIGSKKFGTFHKVTIDHLDSCMAWVTDENGCGQSVSVLMLHDSEGNRLK